MAVSPLQAIIEPASHLARNGIQISDELSGIFQILEPILTMTEASRQLFAPNGELLKSGEIFRAPNLVNVLDQFGKNDLRPIMELFQQEFSEPGGLVTPKDLEELSPKTTHPVHVHVTVRYLSVATSRVGRTACGLWFEITGGAFSSNLEQSKG